MNSSKPNVLVVSSCLLFTEGMKELFRQKMDALVIHAGNCREALEKLRRELIQLAIIEIASEECIGLIREIRKESSGIKILALNHQTDWNKIRGIINAGASGYLLRNSCKEEFFEAVCALMSGRTYISKRLSNMFSESLTSDKPALRTEVEYSGMLTRREHEILKLAGRDYSTKEIAGSLAISHTTVETHRKKIIRKMGVRSLIGALDMAYKRGLLEV